jgi:hypothetical protein
MDEIQTAVYRYGMGLQKGRAARQMRDMKKRSISEREITLKPYYAYTENET